MYGLAGNALNDVAVSKIFSVKDRPFFDPLIVHVDSLDSARIYVKHVPQQAEKLVEKILAWSPDTVVRKERFHL